MTTLVAIPGSIRRASINAGLLRAAAEVAPAGCRVTVASIAAIPLYNADDELASGIPDAVVELKNLIAAADGVLLATPEYNNSIPGVMKNAIDWLSRPPDDSRRVFNRRPIGLLGATPGGMGTALAQAAWLPVMRSLKMRPWFDQMLYIGGAGRLFDEAGDLVDTEIRTRLQDYMDGFVTFVHRDNG